MEFHMNATAPGPGMSRYEFTDSNGYRVGPVIEARTAEEARAKAEGYTGRRDLICTHLSDYHAPGYTDPAFLYGPDYYA